MSRARRHAVAVVVDATGPGGADGADRTLAAVAGLEVDGTPVELVLVGAGSGAAPRSVAGSAIPGVVAVDAEGATHGEALTRGLAAVRADRVAYLRAGATPSSSWLGRALAVLDREHGAAVVCGVATDPGSGEPLAAPVGVAFTGHPLPPSRAPGGDGVRRTMVPAAAWVARRAELEAVDAFDPRLDQPFAGLDLAWKLWLAGRDVLVDPSLGVPVTGAAAASLPGADAGPSERSADEVVRGELDALVTIFRNLDDVSLAVALPPALELSRARVGALAPGGDPAAGERAFTALLPVLETERADRQRGRRRPDAEILGVLGDALAPDTDRPAFVEAHRALVDAQPSLARFAGRRRVVVATADSITERMAGPAIRAWRIASELALDHEVRLVSITIAGLESPSFSVEAVKHAEVPDLVDWCDVFVFQGWVMAGLEAFQRSDKVFVVDIYDPVHLEQLEQARDEGERMRRRLVRDANAVLNEQLLRGDFFLCASTKQRDLWLGSLASLGRINPATYDADPGLDQLIDVVPFGLSDHAPERTGPGVRGVVPGIGADDAVILWGGGVYNWFDPLTLVRAVDRLRTRRPDVRLVFLGMKHPNPDIPEMRMAVETRRLSDELGLTGTFVFFNEDWVPYDQRQNFLLDADLAVTTHFHHVETDFSFRTRVLDYFWATLPTVATNGDSLADLIERRGLGLTVPPEDPDALADALFTLLDDKARAEACRESIRAVAPELVWSEALQPLVEFCRSPRRAPDLMEGLIPDEPGPHPTEVTPAPRGLRADVALVGQYLREGGPTLLVQRVRSRLTRLLAPSSGG